MSINPFPGPQPYRAADRDRFFGRSELAHKVRGSILASRCLTVHGPSGAGKSSLLQAAVLPMLVDKNDARIIRVDSWPEGEEPTKWLASTIANEFGIHSIPEDEKPQETVFKSARSAARASSRPLVIYLDQLEQLLFTGRTVEETQPFFDCVEELVDMPLRTVRVVLSLREDYLGRFRDRLRDLRRITEGGFRVGPLNVAELTNAVVQAAAVGEPSQAWPAEEMHRLMMQVRVPGQPATDDAETQSAYAQIICRALFQERAAGKTIDVTEAEPILRGYLESTVADLGVLRKQAELLLEDHLVSADGSRTLRTEKELARVVPAKDLAVILKQLEGAAILRAEEHHGSRYFEIGHDWLARRVYEQRQTREQVLALERARKQRRLYATIAGISLAIATAGVTLGLYANQKRVAAERAEHAAKAAEEHAKAAEREADERANEAQEEARRGRNLLRMVVARQEEEKDPTTALGLLREMEPGALPRAWASLVFQLNRRILVESVIPLEDLNCIRLAWSPDGTRFALACKDGVVGIVNAAGAGKPLLLRGHSAHVFEVAWSPDGTKLVSASKDKAARVWNADGTGEPVVLQGHEGSVMSAAFSPDGQRIVTASEDKTVRVWKTDGTGVPLVLKGHESTVISAVFSPNGQKIVTASLDKTARVWKTDGTGEPLVLRGHDNAVMNAALNSDGTRIATAGFDRNIRVWRADGAGAPLLLRGHDQPVASVAFGPDNRFVLSSSSYDHTVRVWSLDVHVEPFIVSRLNSGRSAAFHPVHGRYVAYLSGPDIHILAFRRNGMRRRVLRGHDDTINTVAWSHDGQRIVSASTDKTVRVWNADGLGDALVLRGHTGAIASAAFSPDGQKIVSASSDKTVRVWSADGHGNPVVLEGHHDVVESADFSPDGKRIVTASDDKTARVWKFDGTAAPVILEGHQGGVRSAAFSSDGQRIVTASSDATAHVWNADGTGRALILKGHALSINSAAFSPDGQRIVTASFDDTVRVWNADGSGEPVVLHGHEQAVGQALFSPDGKRIVSASQDQTVRIWNADGTGEPLVLSGAMAYNSAAFSPDGTRIVAASDDKTITIWDDVAPFENVDDPRLWSATSYCMPLDKREKLLGFSEAQSRKDLERCQARVVAARPLP